MFLRNLRTSFRIGCLFLLAAPAACSHSPLSLSSHPSPILESADQGDDLLRLYARTRRFRAGRPQSITVTPDASAVLYLRSPVDSSAQNLYEFDTRTAQERVLLTAEQVLQGAEQQLTPEESARRERARESAGGIVSFRLSKDGTKILVPLSGRLFVITRADGKVQELHSDKGFPIDPRFSPDGTMVSCVRGGEVFVTEIATGREWQVTNGAKPPAITNGLSEFVAQEEMGRFEGYWWSPDSRSIAFQQTDTSGVETLYIADAAHPEAAPSPWPYPRAGRANAKVRLGVVPAAGGDTTWVPWDAEAYEYLATVKWTEKAPLTIVVQNRRQTDLVVYAVEPASGSTRELLREHDDAWINLDQKMPRWFPDGSAFFWTTEREGAAQLEVRSGDDGHRLGSLVPPYVTFQGFLDFDDAHKTAYILATKDPTQRQVYQIRLDRGPAGFDYVTRLSGLHNAVFAENFDAHVLTAELMGSGRADIVRRRDGTEIGRIASTTPLPGYLPNVEINEVGGDRTYFAAVVRPRDFDGRRRYPVINYVYGGPGGQMVTASPESYYWHQWLADQGFIVVSIDGRGTPHRGRDWERAIKHDLIAIPLEDQATAMRLLGERYVEMDLSRVGIFGWSFGGYFSAHAVMQRPDVFHVGVAGAPVADWTDYDTHYTERFMGLPAENEAGYENASVLTHAAKLSRPLLIMHGTADDNVYFCHSLKMSAALLRAGRAHEFLPISDFTHMLADVDVSMRVYERVAEFFERNLTQSR